ncbi:MAG: flagellin [Parvularculaceae bacterium]|nr:flagellin [Parvularculaceae bacterium]
MTRISDLGFQQILLSSFQRAQSGAQARQAQLASGKISDRYSGVGVRTEQLLNSESVFNRATAYESAAGVAASRLQVQEAGLETVADSLARLRARFVTALSTGSAELIGPELATETQRILSALNTETGGVYVFGGTDGSVRPVDARTIDDLIAAADVNDLFVVGSRTRLPVEEGTTVDGGATADEISSGILARLKELGEAPATLGPFVGQLTQDQADFLVQKVAEFDALSAALVQHQGANGIAQGQVDAAVDRNVQRRNLAEIVASEIEDVDLAEVIARLDQDRLAIEAAAQALAQSRELSLLNFL